MSFLQRAFLALRLYTNPKKGILIAHKHHNPTLTT